MDIEHLSKSQIVLLTLLVSFVTSIATGIVTVSLMDQAPPGIAQTVNRVIERTVEKVAPAGQAAASVVTQQTTVVVKESDLIAQAVERVSPSLVRLYASSEEGVPLLGFAVVLDASGTLAADGSALDSGDVVAQLSDGSRVRAFVTTRDASSGVVFLRTATSTLDEKSPTWSPIAVSNAHSVLGETVVALSGRTAARIAAGIITSFMSGKGDLQIIDTDIATDSIASGSPLIDADGSLIGVSTGVARASSPSGFISASALMLKQEEKTEQKKDL